MDAIFNICRDGSCGIHVEGLEQANGEYLNEDTKLVSRRNYKYAESVTLNVFKRISSEGDITIKSFDVLEHTLTNIDEYDYEFPEDGLYEISHIILPNREYVRNLIKTHSTKEYSHVFYYDGECKEFDVESYEHVKNENVDEVIDRLSQTISVDQLLEIDPCYKENGLPITIIRADKPTFSLCFIKECFYKLAKDILSKFCGKCIGKLGYTKEDTYNRDIIWMSLNIIEYLLEKEEYVEAQRILESISQCSNICGNIEAKKGGCGCGS